MKYKTIFLIIAALLFLSACPDSPTNPKDENPYKQEAIDWPSLADSPWPMYHGGPLGNGMSFQSGPVNRTVKWKVDIIDIGMGVVIDDSGYVYFSSFAGKLYKISSAGEIVWEKQLVNNYIDDSGTPILLCNGNIFINLGKQAFIINKAGVVLNEIVLPDYVDMPSFQIDKEGNLYSVTRDRHLFKMTPEGEILWSILPPDSLDDNFILSTFLPVFDSKGSVLIVSAYNNLYGISTDGAVNWFYPMTVSAPPIVNSNGYIYAYDETDTSIICLSNTGGLTWSRKIDSTIKIEGLSRPAVTPDGDIVYPTYSPPGVVKFSPEGELIWQTALPEGLYVCSELLTDADGNVYVSTYQGGFYVLSGDGKIIAEIGSDLIVGMSPAISNGVLYFGDQNGINGGLYAVE